MELIPWFLKSAILLSTAALAVSLLSRASAAVRHVVWWSGIAALLLLPFATRLMPTWTPAAATYAQSPDAPARVVLTIVAGEERNAATMPWVWMVWGAGAALLLGREGMLRLLAYRMVRRAVPHETEPGVVVSGSVTVPAVYGVMRPVIVLPESSSEWSDERLALVLEHEQMHIRRKDPLTYFIARCVAAVWWPQPLVWYAMSRLVSEAEQAADDGVLAVGTLPSVYASHLVDIARSVSFALPASRGGLHMVRKSELERRLKALFNPSINRRPLARGAFAVATIAAAALLLPLAAVRAPAQQGVGIAGVVEDVSGARVPSARVTVTSADGRLREFAISGADGAFALSPLVEGVYNLKVAAPGFALLQLNGVEVAPGKGTNLKLVLNVGSISERMTVQGQGAPAPVSAAPEAAPGGPRRLNIGGNVQASKLVARENPIYPPDCKAERIEGTVLLKAVIGTDGSVLNVERVNQLVDSRLADEAIAAVRHWRYEPTLLNGRPVEVLTEIEINFILNR